MPLTVLNPELYADRTVQDWHRSTFGRNATAIDLDLMGACKRCSAPLYLIESTTNPDKHTNILRRLAVITDVPAYLVIHDRRDIDRVITVHPTRGLLGGVEEFKDCLQALREQHQCRQGATA